MADSTVTQDGGSTEAKPELKRVMGPKLLMLFVVGDILGASIYTLTGKVAGHVGGALWLPFLIAFVVAFLTAFSYLELVGKYPRAAGAALYVNRAFGVQFLTFMIAFAVMCSGITSAGVAAQGFSGKYLQEFVDAPSLAVAIGFIIVLALVNFRGVNESVKLNVILTIIELSGLLIVIAVGFFAILEGRGEPGRLLEFDTEGGAFFGVTAATALAFYALVGFEDSVNMAEECRNPVKIFPKAMLGGIIICGIIYLLVAVASSVLLPVEQLSSTTAPLLDVVKAGAPGFPPLLFAGIALFAVINSALINMLMASRLVYGMANERVIPHQFATVHPFRRTPWIAILFTSVIAIVLVSSLNIENLGGTTSLLLLTVFAFVNVAVLVLRKDKVEHKHFRAPTIIPVLGAISCAFFALPITGRNPKEYLYAGILLGVGLVFWLINYFAMGRKKVDFDPSKLSA
ncbi:APC family permease [Amycolatopsis suaedae]|uniref:Amino acid permease n=1 Tax=Amycolatopsis suaedae TaxID=2510978 RepID=A0A4Q7J8J3_9PSEU|nr:APC family permease [Amycolatopsis suaedae]RZQ63298.1 amino acid permease [Amycolatopsis suaedae]